MKGEWRSIAEKHIGELIIWCEVTRMLLSSIYYISYEISELDEEVQAQGCSRGRG
jgi:hypothetical protein